MGIRIALPVAFATRLGASLGSLGAALLLTLALGCGSKSGSVDGLNQLYGNYHSAGWVSLQPGVSGNHATQAVASLETCQKCHLMAVQVSNSAVPGCLTAGCHHTSRPAWVNTDPGSGGEHGGIAKGARNASGGLAGCQLCHGNASGPTGGLFAGGLSGKSCYTCHAPATGGPVAAPHPPKPWRVGGGSTLSHALVDPSNAPICAQCHYPKSPNNPANHPATPAPAATAPGCFNSTLCHGNNTAPHAVPFLAGQTDSRLNGHLTVTATTFAADCATCHAYAGTSPLAAAPLCSVCHTVADPTLSGSNAGTCLSCHVGAPGLPTGPNATSFPNIAGAHAKHLTLATALTCDTCHAGSGTRSVTHYSNANARVGAPAGPAPVAIDPVYKAKTGGNPVFTGTSSTCSNVSCHGSQTTPNWQIDKIDSSTQCTVCHAVAATAGLITQYNDAFGRHSLGTHNATTPINNIACTTCHDMANGSLGALAHFKYLNTPAVDGVSTGTPADQLPSGTIAFDTAIVTAGTYTVTSSTQGNGGCALACHSHTHVVSIDTWTATGAPHKVPFLPGLTDAQGNGHTTATQATFGADCSACHALSGTSPMASAPLCETCHTRGDPTATTTGSGTCLSCHGDTSGMPAGPTGSTFPSIAGAHARHMALPTPLTCDTCHAGSGTGTATHYTNADARVTPPTSPATVSISATYNAQSGGTATFSPSTLTCSSSSCHGGKVTPNWQTESLNSATQCTACHTINDATLASQYNDAIGRHAWGTHATAGTLDCTLCHDMTTGNTNPGAANHFAELNTTAVSSTNKLPSGTVKFKLTSTTYPITGVATYTLDATHLEGDGGCALTCHGQIHEPVTNHWNAAKGSGVAHPLPFLDTDVSTGGNHHQTLTLAQFNAECATCHDQSGTTAKTGPTCVKCHTLGSPLTAGMTAGTCLSCHVGASFTTQGPTDSAWPNLKGAHSKHLLLPTLTRTSPALPASLTASAYPKCETCHVGSVPGDSAQTHYSNANKRTTNHPIAGPASVTVNSTFNAQSGTAGNNGSASALTCSNVSCHGGQTTPGWQGGTLAVNATTYCIACHKVTSTASQYNDATGRHSDPGEHKVVCSYCHDMTQALPGAQNHFKYLDTTAVSGVSGTPSDQYPSDTIKFDTSVIFPNGGGPSYTPSPQGAGYCTLTCHSGGEQHDSGRHWR